VIVAQKAERPGLLRYANEKLGKAVQVLATNPGDVKVRLQFAAEHLARVPTTALPARPRAEFESIWRELTRRPGLSPVSATLRRMRLAAACKLAARIVALRSSVAWRCR
jgi:hypothetical protein